MKAAKPLAGMLLALVLFFFACVVDAAGLEVKTASYGPHAALYSFSDVYRLTVSGAAMVEAPQLLAGADSPLRVSAAEPATPGYVFSIVSVPEPQRGLLLLSGLALMIWVARRRLVHSF